MAWVYRGNVNLPQTDRDNNAWEIYNFFNAENWALESIAAMVGNIDVESTVNPERINANSGASGLTQLLGQRLTWMKDYVENTLSYSSWTNGDGQIRYILLERNDSSYEGWLKRGGYDRTFAQFASNSENDSLEDLTYMWQMCYERVSIGVPVPVRYTRAQYYYELFSGSPPPPTPGEVPPWLLFKWKERRKRVKCTVHL